MHRGLRRKARRSRLPTAGVRIVAGSQQQLRRTGVPGWSSDAVTSRTEILECCMNVISPAAAAPCPLDQVNRWFRAPRPNGLWVSDLIFSIRDKLRRGTARE